MPFSESEVGYPNPEIDRRPCIMVCNWAGDGPVWDMVEDLTGVPWQPENARSELVTVGTDMAEMAGLLAERLSSQQARALLLIGRTGHEGPALLQMRAVVPTRDGQRMDEASPGVVRATAPIPDIIQAITAARVPVMTTSRSEDDAGSELLYRVMTSLDDLHETPSVALLRFPHSMSEACIAPAVKAAATAMTQHMAPAPRFTAAGRS